MEPTPTIVKMATPDKGKFTPTDKAIAKEFVFLGYGIGIIAGAFIITHIPEKFKKHAIIAVGLATLIPFTMSMLEHHKVKKLKAA